MKIKLLFAICAVTVLLHNQCTPKKQDAKEADKNQITTAKPIQYQLEEVWATEATLKTPESVIYDEERDILYISNVNENPWEKDGNGFISKVSTGGEIIELEWVTGMNGPKGMAILGNNLYVADIDEVIIIDIEKGELVDKIMVEGATGLNDITPGVNNDLFISDSNGGKLYHYANEKTTLFHADTPGRPNGLFVDKGKLLVASSQAMDFVSYDLKTKEKSPITADIGHGDGITPTNEAGTYLVSDWSGEIFVVYPDGSKKSLLRTKDDEKNTADIWFIGEQELVLVPTFFDNRVVAYKLKKS